MKIDARGLKHPKPLEKLREHLRGNCKKEINFDLLVDTSQCTKFVTAFARMSKCNTEIAKADGHFVVSVRGGTCACA